MPEAYALLPPTVQEQLATLLPAGDAARGDGLRNAQLSKALREVAESLDEMPTPEHNKGPQTTLSRSVDARGRSHCCTRSTHPPGRLEHQRHRALHAVRALDSFEPTTPQIGPNRPKQHVSPGILEARVWMWCMAPSPRHPATGGVFCSPRHKGTVGRTVPPLRDACGDSDVWTILGVSPLPARVGPLSALRI